LAAWVNITQVAKIFTGMRFYCGALVLFYQHAKDLVETG